MATTRMRKSTKKTSRKPKRTTRVPSILKQAKALKLPQLTPEQLEFLQTELTAAELKALIKLIKRIDASGLFFPMVTF